MNILEALPGGTALFAQAYQRQIGGSKTGKDAIAQLMDDMKKGRVKSDILTFAAQLASERAQPTLGAASRASQAEQARFQNVTSDMAALASNRGVEEGFARIFRTLRIGLQESNGMVGDLAEGFNDVSKVFSDVLLSAQSLQRFFEGRDSYLGDKFFPTEEDRNTAFTFLGTYKNTMQEIVTLGGNVYSGWEKLINLLDGSSVIDKLTSIMNLVANAAGALNDMASGNYSAAAEKAKAAAFGYAQTITAPGRAVVDPVAQAVTGRSLTDRLQGVAPFNPAEFESNVRARQAQELADRKKQNFSGALIFPNNAGNGSNAPPMITPTVDIKMEVNVASANPEDFNDAFQAKVKEVWQTTLLQFSQKE